MGLLEGSMVIICWTSDCGITFSGEMTNSAPTYSNSNIIYSIQLGVHVQFSFTVFEELTERKQWCSLEE